jgi:hypothetical protein
MSRRVQRRDGENRTGYGIDLSGAQRQAADRDQRPVAAKSLRPVRLAVSIPYNVRPPISSKSLAATERLPEPRGKLVGSPAP